jgi:hypothetical protein
VMKATMEWAPGKQEDDVTLMVCRQVGTVAKAAA